MLIDGINFCVVACLKMSLCLSLVLFGLFFRLDLHAFLSGFHIELHTAG